MKNRYLIFSLYFLMFFAYHGLMNVMIAGAGRSSGLSWLATLLLAAFCTSIISTTFVLDFKNIWKNKNES